MWRIDYLCIEGCDGDDYIVSATDYDSYTKEYFSSNELYRVKTNDICLHLGGKVSSLPRNENIVQQSVLPRIQNFKVDGIDDQGMDQDGLVIDDQDGHTVDDQDEYGIDDQYEADDKDGVDYAEEFWIDVPDEDELYDQIGVDDQDGVDDRRKYGADDQTSNGADNQNGNRVDDQDESQISFL